MRSVSISFTSFLEYNFAGVIALPKLYVKTLERWAQVADRLREKGYRTRYWQYDYYEPQGSHAAFWKTGVEDVVVVTHNEEIQQEMIKFPS